MFQVILNLKISRKQAGADTLCDLPSRKHDITYSACLILISYLIILKKNCKHIYILIALPKVSGFSLQKIPKFAKDTKVNHRIEEHSKYE